jgi:hypothetical protein
MSATVAEVDDAEGTSSEGSTVLPFRSSLLQAAAISQAAITPAD